MKIINTPIDVMTYTDSEGKPIPVRIRLQDRYNKYSVIKIDKILSSKKKKIGDDTVITYRCQCILNNIKKIYDLKYYLSKAGDVYKRQGLPP